MFADRCVAGIEANVERCREYAESSPSIVTPLNHYVGYDEAAKIAKQALAERKTIREVVIERGHVPGRAHRGAARRGPRRAVDDPPRRSDRAAAVVFDFYGTLAPGRTHDDQTRVRAAQAAALGVDPARFDAELTATIDARFRGAGGTVEGSLRWVAERLGGRPGARRRSPGQRRFGWRPSGASATRGPSAEPVLRTLHERGLRIGLISDCSAELPVYFPDLADRALRRRAGVLLRHRRAQTRPGRLPAVLRAARHGAGPAASTSATAAATNSRARGASGCGRCTSRCPGESGAVVYERHRRWDGETITALPEVLDLV